MLVGLAVIVGMLGYFAFGAKADTVILLNMPNNHWTGIAAKLFYSFTIMGSFVLLIQPIFYVMESSSWYKNILDPQPAPAAEAAPEFENDYSSQPQRRNRHLELETTMQRIVYVFFRLVIVALVVLISFTFPNLNLVLTLGGSILGTIMTIIIPISFYNRAYSNDFKHQKHDKTNNHLEDQQRLLDDDIEVDPSMEKN